MTKTAWIWSALLATVVAFSAEAGAQDSRRGALSRGQASEHRGALQQRKASAAAPKRAPEPGRDKGRTLAAQRGNAPAPRRR